MATKEKAKKKKIAKGISAGIAQIQASFNNKIITITDKQGNVLVWSAPGIVGYGGSKKSTPFAAQIAATDAARKAKEIQGTPAEFRVLGIRCQLLQFGQEGSFDAMLRHNVHVLALLGPTMLRQ